MQFYDLPFHSAQQCIRIVILVKRFENNHFIARIGDRRSNDAIMPSVGPAADRNLALRIGFEPIRPHVFSRDGLPERLRPPGDRILVMIGENGLDRRLFQFRRSGEIRKPLGEIGGIRPNRQTRHLADH